MIWSKIIHYSSLESTSDVARELAAAGAGEGLVVTACQQTGGRGRRGRSWYSPAGEGLYMSAILKPQVKASSCPLITLASSIAVADVLKSCYGITADIKWPNDVLSQGRKISGILVESKSEGELVKYAILGIGVNVKQREFPEDLGDTATSVYLETGLYVSPEELLVPLLEELARWYPKAMSNPLAVISSWQERSSSSSNCEVMVTNGGGEFEGYTRGVRGDGALLVQKSDGDTIAVTSGEVTLRFKVSG